MLTSFLVAVIAIILRFVIWLLADRWDFFTNLILPFDIAMWVSIALFAVFTAIYVVKYMKEKL